ncbi:replication initiator A domain-containing protein, partial [Butyricicoccus sp. 1XD8-22]
MPLKLDYFYGNQAEQYSFYRIPKALFTDSRYKGVSVEAKVLYGLLLDRMSLSARNEWFDSNRRVYIYFTLEDALSQMGCGKDKAIKLFKELDVVSGIGLIERKKQGQGKPTRIYVKNFIIPEMTNPPTPSEPSAAPDPPPEPEPPTTPEPSPMPEPSHAAEAQTSENQKSKPLNIMGIKALEE